MATRWWGWGSPDQGYPPEALEAVLAFLEDRGLRPGPRAPDPDLPALPATRLSAGGLDALRAVAEVTTEPADRVAHSLGQGYLDLLQAREPAWEEATDAVAYPRSVEEVQGLLRLADGEGWAVVPYGGGTSVVGGVRPLANGRGAVLTVDLRNLDRVREVDPVSRLVRAEAGLRGPQLEEALADHGLTLGHFPQSFHHSTLGGWIATRSTGCLSTDVGRMEDLVRGVRLVAPDGEAVARAVPARAAGPEVREWILGSEGALGIVVEAWLRVRPLPAVRARRALLVPSFAQGVALCRATVQEGGPPAFLRLLDGPETALAAAVRGIPLDEDGCLALLAHHGPADRAEVRLEGTVARWTEAGALDLGPDPVVAWEEEYYRAPYLRDELVARGLLVDALETAVPWAGVEALHAGVRTALAEALRADGQPGLVLAHLSHAYPDGASLYFTLLAPRTSDPVGQWHRLKASATDAVLAGGGTLSHHHGIGVDHRRWLEREHGSAALRAWRALKEALDPRGIMNPGKLEAEEP